MVTVASKPAGSGAPVTPYSVLMASVLSVNVGRASQTRHSAVGATGIDKRPVDGPVFVADPGPRGVGASGIAGDAVCNLKHHGGTDQALYAYAREDLDRWEGDLGRELPPGVFGENLTTLGLDPAEALIGEHWEVGECLFEVSTPRIPCRTFAGWLEQTGWIERFTERGASGLYLRVLRPGRITAGQTVTVVTRPDHDVTVGLAFRALTTERALLPRLLAAGDALTASDRAAATRQADRAEATRQPGPALTGEVRA